MVCSNRTKKSHTKLPKIKVLVNFSIPFDVLFQEISIPSQQKVFWFEPPLPHPSKSSSIASYFPLKCLAFQTLNPSEFLMTFLGLVMDIFWSYTICNEKTKIVLQTSPYLSTMMMSSAFVCCLAIRRARSFASDLHNKVNKI